MKRKWIALTLTLLPLILLSGCLVPGQSGGGLNPVKIVQNPWVMIIGVIAIVWWLSQRGKSK